MTGWLWWTTAAVAVVDAGIIGWLAVAGVVERHARRNVPVRPIR